MFKSSENLRLTAAMRALTRVASPWREARATWFDGTPESIEARLAATDRVLVHAQSGLTAAHLELTREALAARRELVEAKHRLLTDFLDDGARAFKGSKRVAGEPIIDLSSNGGETGSSTSLRHRDDQANNRFTLQHPEGYGDRARVITNHDDTELMSADGVHHWASQRVADALYDHQPGRTYHYGPVPRGGTSEEEFEVPPEELVDFIQNHRGGHADDVYHTDPNWPNSRHHLPSSITDEWSGDTDVSGLPEQRDWTGDYKYKHLGSRHPFDRVAVSSSGDVWPDDYPKPEGTGPVYNDDDTLTCPNCGYDEVEQNRAGECPECDFYHADFIDDSDGDHNSWEAQMERKYPILPEHGGPASLDWNHHREYRRGSLK